jgi:predicted CxxxxCH...CXXCH cytochrome family protein
LLASAPPFDLKGNTDPRYPGVGAHDIHLVQSDTHPAFECSECHVVPETTRAPGHMDSSRPAELDFGVLAGQGDREPRYNPVTRRCANTYCHGARSESWTRARSSEAACGSCHGLPPPFPHPAHDDCGLCHADVIDSNAVFTHPNRHVNGRVELEPPGCSSCHGSQGDPAPPRDLSGSSDTSSPGVGAHRIHLSPASSRPLACEECHRVPTELAQPGHLDGSGVEVEVAGLGTRGGRDPHYDPITRSCADTYCHGSAEQPPVWNDALERGCANCHAMPPPPPHPAMENCGACHSPVAGLDENGAVVIREAARHVDGQLDVREPDACNACHGDPGGEGLRAAAPPRDTFERSETEERGVGAHAAHVLATGRARPLGCAECHVVPETSRALGHVDTKLPAEVAFSGIAFAFDAEPSYEDGTCRNTYCHGGSFIGGRPSGGGHVHPSWTLVDASQTACDGCHGMPPPLPHPQDAGWCGECHHNIDEGDQFSRPLLHVDGIVTFRLGE